MEDGEFLPRAQIRMPDRAPPVPHRRPAVEDGRDQRRHRLVHNGDDPARPPSARLRAGADVHRPRAGFSGQLRRRARPARAGPAGDAVRLVAHLSGHRAPASTIQTPGTRSCGTVRRGWEARRWATGSASRPTGGTPFGRTERLSRCITCHSSVEPVSKNQSRRIQLAIVQSPTNRHHLFVAELCNTLQTPEETAAGKPDLLMAIRARDCS